MKATMMKCGHAANGRMNGGPVCVMCLGIDPGASVVDEAKADLTDRMARCSYCGAKRPSSPSLPFFGHLDGREYDSFYCGCRGWD